MTCYHPLKGYRSLELNRATGRYGITFNAMKALNADNPVQLPCGRCVGCRLDKSIQWQTRLTHEAKLYEPQQTHFLTLTYDQDHVPTSYGLNLKEWQRFMYRLRKKMGAGIRFYAVGEYGEEKGRPHYHAILYGVDFSDRKQIKISEWGPVFHSATLSRLWTLGGHELGTVTPQSTGYVARYAMKKVNGDRAADHYSRVSPIDGERYNVRPEFSVMSRRPGIGDGWYQKWASDAFPSDFIIIDGQKRKPPAYYLKKMSDDDQKPIKRTRKRFANKQRENNTKARLAVREEIQHLRAKRLLRKLED